MRRFDYCDILRFCAWGQLESVNTMMITRLLGVGEVLFGQAGAYLGPHSRSTVLTLESERQKGIAKTSEKALHDNRIYEILKPNPVKIHVLHCAVALQTFTSPGKIC